MQDQSLFLKGLGKGFTEASVYHTLTNVGVAGLSGVQIAKHRSGRSAGFCILSFHSHADASTALSKLDQFMLCGRRLNVRWYSPSENSESMKQQQQQQQRVGEALESAPRPLASGASFSAPIVSQAAAVNFAQAAAAAQQQQQQQQQQQPLSLIPVKQQEPLVLATPQPKAQSRQPEASPMLPWRHMPLSTPPGRLGAVGEQEGASQPCDETPCLSHLMGMWLNNGPKPPLSHQEDVLGPSSQDPVQAATPLMHRSFDDLTPCHQKKRTPQQQLADEVSQTIDSLDLSGLPPKSSGKKADDPGSFGKKSRLITKWGVSLQSRFADESVQTSPPPPEPTPAPPAKNSEHSSQESGALSSAAIPFFTSLPKQSAQQVAPQEPEQQHIPPAAQGTAPVRSLSLDAAPWPHTKTSQAAPIVTAGPGSSSRQSPSAEPHTGSDTAASCDQFPRSHSTAASCAPPIQQHKASEVAGGKKGVVLPAPNRVRAPGMQDALSQSTALLRCNAALQQCDTAMQVAAPAPVAAPPAMPPRPHPQQLQQQPPASSSWVPRPAMSMDDAFVQAALPFGPHQGMPGLSRHHSKAASMGSAFPLPAFPATAGLAGPGIMRSQPLAQHLHPLSLTQQQQAQASQLCAAQKQYAQALAAMEAARSQIIAASAAFPGIVSSMPLPFPGMECPDATAAMAPLSPMHAGHPLHTMPPMMHPAAALVGYGYQ